MKILCISRLSHTWVGPVAGSLSPSWFRFFLHSVLCFSFPTDLCLWPPRAGAGRERTARGAAERLIAVEVPALALFHAVLVVGTSGLLKEHRTTALCGSVVLPVFISPSPDSSPLVHIQPLSLKVHLPSEVRNLPWAPWHKRTRRPSCLAKDDS